MKSSFLLMSLALSFHLMSCQGQIKKPDDTKAEDPKPKTNVIVNKEYDDDGNLIKYDSTYSYYYSNIEGDTLLEDSILQNFRQSFNKNYFFSEDPFFSNFFFQDSLMMYDFYKDDFFTNRFMGDMQRMDSIFKGMDSFKNQFFKKQFK